MRDPREITVAGDARSTRPAAQGSRRAPAGPAASTPEWRLILGAVVGGTVRTCRARPGAMIGSVVTLGAVALVSMNALGFQVGRHPAPILPKVAVRQDARPAPAVPGKPPEAAGAPDPARLPAKIAEPGRAPARDAIADLIRSEDTTASVTAKPQNAVMRAQRALSKLGYGPLKADGVMGAGTRAAIEKFERDRKLPVKGEAGGRTLRELATRAGLPPA